MPSNFFNKGFGWTCSSCVTDNDPAASRLMIEGEAESRNPELSEPARAVWADSQRTTLECPHCGITEAIKPVD